MVCESVDVRESRDSVPLCVCVVAAAAAAAAAYYYCAALCAADGAPHPPLKVRAVLHFPVEQGRASTERLDLSPPTNALPGIFHPDTGLVRPCSYKLVSIDPSA